MGRRHSAQVQALGVKPPRPLWPAWKPIALRLKAAPRLAVFSDFDGTLAPIVRHPGQSRLPAPTRAALVRLRRLSGVAVGIVSGRSLRDLRAKVRLRKICYIGSHGLEWTGPDGRRHSKVSAALASHLQELGRKLEAEVGRLPGIYVERKTLSVAVHYRNATPRVARQARQAAERRAKRAAKKLRLLRGKKIVELLQAGRMDKGQAVMALAGRLRRRGGPRPLLIYLGDDTTDETVFPRLRRGDLGIHVGPGAGSRARYRLASPAEVTRFLVRLREVLA